MEEIWKYINGYDNLYQISNLGRVKSLSRKVNHSSGGLRLINERILKQSTNIHGYLYITINYKYKYKINTIHRLIAMYFIPNPENKPMVNHIDGNKKNNNISNLEWVTAKENMQHSWHIGLQKTSQKRILATRNSTMKKVINLDNGVIYDSITVAEKETGIKKLGRRFNNKNNNLNLKLYELS